MTYHRQIHSEFHQVINSVHQS